MYTFAKSSDLSSEMLKTRIEKADPNLTGRRCSITIHNDVSEKSSHSGIMALPSAIPLDGWHGNAPHFLPDPSIIIPIRSGHSRSIKDDRSCEKLQSQQD